jgi:hypothetical protein
MQQPQHESEERSLHCWPHRGTWTARRQGMNINNETIEAVSIIGMLIFVVTTALAAGIIAAVLIVEGLLWMVGGWTL